MSIFTSSGMRGESYFIGMRSPGQQGCLPEDGGLFLLCCIDRDWAVTRCFAEEAFQAITDFNDLPNSLFACNVHQSVFEGEESKVIRLSCSWNMGGCGIIPKYFHGSFVVDVLNFLKMFIWLYSWHESRRRKTFSFISQVWRCLWQGCWWDCWDEISSSVTCRSI